MLDTPQYENENEKNKEEIGGIFHVVSEKQQQKTLEKDLLDEYDSSIFSVPFIRDWTAEEVGWKKTVQCFNFFFVFQWLETHYF